MVGVDIGGAGQNIAAGPSGYSDHVYTESGNGNSHAGISTSYLTNTASSEDPGAVTIGVSDGYIALVIAVLGTGGGGGGSLLGVNLIGEGGLISQGGGMVGQGGGLIG